MQDDLYFYIMVLGLIFIGFAWLLPERGSKGKARETENLSKEDEGMGMVHILAEIRQDMDKKISLLSNQIRDLRTEVERAQLSSAEGPITDIGKGLKLDQRYAEIFELLQQGKSELEIATMLDMGVGEVKMIIQLHRVASGHEKRNGHGGNTP